MTAKSKDDSASKLKSVSAWLKSSSLRGDSLEIVVGGCCERLSAAGIPIARAHFSFSMLHPLYGALNFTWERGSPLEELQMSADARESDRFARSPYYYLLRNGLERLRIKIVSAENSQFPIVDDLRVRGITDYLALAQNLGSERGRAMLCSWATDSAGGFGEEMIDALAEIQTDLAVAAKMAISLKLTENMLTTYLGCDAGKRVLSGQVRRGDGETVRAMLVMVDMRESTKFAESKGRQIYIDVLNEFFDAVAEPFNGNGGEILSFIGDGFLAVYPCGRNRKASSVAAQAAMAAVWKAIARMHVLNLKRKNMRHPEIRYGVGLHVGNVMYGNVGLKDRLAFSAFGAAVNEVERLQALTKKYHRSIVASPAFSEYCGGKWIRLGEEILRGVSQPITIVSPASIEIEPDVEAHFLDIVRPDAASEAEQIIMLQDELNLPALGRKAARRHRRI